ncbi:hypothetical protein ACFL02_04980 [Planctomycetota bacterium]
MQEDRQNRGFLPDGVTEYITSVIRKVRYRRRVRQEVQQELTDHFSDALTDCESESQKQQLTQQMIAGFGDAKLLARLIRRAKKRCRPIWKKALIRTGQVMLVAYIISCICNAWVIHSWAAYSDIDYTEKFNQLSRPDTPQAQNAAPYYEKAARLYVEPPKSIEDIVLSSSASLTEPNQDQQALIEKWFADNEPAWQQVVAATEIPYCWWEVDEISSENIENAIQQPKTSRTFTRLGLARARQKAAQNQPDQALDQCYTVLRMGNHFSGPKLLIEHLVGTACITRAQLYLLSMLDACDPEKLPLDQMQNQLQAIFPDGFPLLNSQVEMNWSLGSIQYMYSYTGTIGLKGYLYPGMFLFIGNRDRLEARAQALHENLFQFSPYEYQLMTPKNEGRALSSPEMLVDMTRQPFERTRDVNYCYKALHEALVTILALQRQKLDKGAFPENLDALLTDGYLQTLPDDPYSDTVLKYQRQGDSFILYSLGADFDDDGGVENHQDPWGREETGGDRVFWPYVPREGT